MNNDLAEVRHLLVRAAPSPVTSSSLSITQTGSSIEGSLLAINSQDKYGFTVLHCAVEKVDINPRIIVELLSFPGINVNIQNNDCNTPLHYFCQKFKYPDECQEIFELLVKKGASINAQNKFGETPLHKAIFNNTIRLLLVEILLEQGADVNVLTKDGETPLHYAVRLGRKDLVQVLMTKKADITIRGHKSNKTPYELASMWGFTEMADHLKKYQGMC
jgi:ankyrin repeat protein